MYEKLERSHGTNLGYRITSSLDRNEAAHIARELETAIDHGGEVRVLFDLQAPPYGDIGAAWEDLRFDVRHAGDLERCAVVGDRKVERIAVETFDALAPAECRFFERGEAERAWSWLVA